MLGPSRMNSVSWLSIASNLRVIHLLGFLTLGSLFGGCMRPEVSPSQRLDCGAGRRLVSAGGQALCVGHLDAELGECLAETPFTYERWGLSLCALDEGLDEAILDAAAARWWSEAEGDMRPPEEPGVTTPSPPGLTPDPEPSPDPELVIDQGIDLGISDQGSDQGVADLGLDRRPTPEPLPAPVPSDATPPNG